MSSGSLEITVVSASISPHTSFENEPNDTYAILRCAKEQHCTTTARDQGRLPVWNETFKFELEEQDMSDDIVVQVFSVRTEVDELLGLVRIPIFTMVGKEEATLCSLISPSKGETGKLKAAWKWKPDSQRTLKATSFEGQGSGLQGHNEDYASGGYDLKVPPYGGYSVPVAYPHVLQRDQEPYAKLDAVSDAMAKLSVDKGGSGRSTASAPPYMDDSVKAGKGMKAQGCNYSLHSSSAGPGMYPVEGASVSKPSVYSGYPEVGAYNEGGDDSGIYSSSSSYSRGSSDYGYPPPADRYPPNPHPAYPPHPGTAYPPAPADTFPSKTESYPPYPGAVYPPTPADAYPPNRDAYPPHPGTAYPPPPTDAFPPNRDDHGTAYPPYHAPYPDYESSSISEVHGEAMPTMEKGGGGKEKGKGHGSHTAYGGQPPPAGYPPSSYPPAPGGYPPASYPPPYGYPPAAPHGYPPAPHGYPPAVPPGSHGYPPAPQGYPPQGYPPAGHQHSAPAYPSYGYPPAHGSHHASPAEKHGVAGHGVAGHALGYAAAAAAGAYVGHSSSKLSKKHKDPKHSSSHKHGHGKHKKQKSFKGMKFKKFKMFKF